MKFNKYMHPRNIYRKPANFKELAITYPEFRRHAQQDLTGKVYIDFKDPDALRALTTTLLQKDFGLNVYIPPNRLVPTLPLRLNYLLWVEDLLNSAGITENIRGIDIGTGPACVYPLIGTKHFNWSFLATELNEESHKCAKENVMKNKVEEKVEVIHVEPDVILKDVVEKREGQFDFCMCNPPFFSSEEEKQQSLQGRSNKKPPPTSVQTGATEEVIVQGGEVQFISRMIRESKQLGKKVRIYTSMIGRKTSLTPLKLALKDAGACQFVETVFCQGRTMRWGLGWTFDPTVTFPSFVKPKMKKTKPFSFSLPCDGSTAVDTVVGKVEEMLTKLKIHFRCIRQTDGECILYLTARENTWTHQRRLRREAKRKAEESAVHVNLKRKNSANEEGLPKRQKLDSGSKTADVSPANVVMNGSSDVLKEQGDFVAANEKLVSKAQRQEEAEVRHGTDEKEGSKNQTKADAKVNVTDRCEISKEQTQDVVGVKSPVTFQQHDSEKGRDDSEGRKLNNVKLERIDISEDIGNDKPVLQLNGTHNTTKNCTEDSYKIETIEDEEIGVEYSDSESVEVISDDGQREEGEKELICIDDSNEGFVVCDSTDDVTIIEKADCSVDSDDIVVVEGTSKKACDIAGDTDSARQSKGSVEPETEKNNQQKVKKYYKCVFQGKVIVTKDENEIYLSVQYRQGTGGMEAAHQVLQYFRNNLKL